MTVVTSIADLRALARRRVPRALFHYADGGSYDEITLHRNRTDLDAISFRQRVACDVSRQTLGTTVVGQRVSMPVGIAPTGLAGFYWRDGEIVGAQAAQAKDVAFCLSTMSICSLEEVSAAVTQPIWFQLYLMRDRGFNAELIARAGRAKCSALVLTLDLQVQGLRRKEFRCGLSIPPRLTFSSALDVARRPGWARQVLFGKRRTLGNFAGHPSTRQGLTTLAQWIATQFDPAVTWKDVEWVRNNWDGKLIVKGILDPEDARHAHAVGADAVVVSNHGGRQLDGAASTISALPRIAESLEGSCELLFDGGIQSGQDVFRALALGARACLIGKAFIYALAARGGSGVELALDIIRKELAVTMALTGCADVHRIDSTVLQDIRAIPRYTRA